MQSVTPVSFRQPFPTVPNDETPESIKELCRAVERLNAGSSNSRQDYDAKETHDLNHKYINKNSHKAPKKPNNNKNDRKTNQIANANKNKNENEYDNNVLPHIVDTSLQSPLNARCMSYHTKK